MPVFDSDSKLLGGRRTTALWNCERRSRPLVCVGRRLSAFWADPARSGHSASGQQWSSAAAGIWLLRVLNRGRATKVDEDEIASSMAATRHTDPIIKD